MIEYYFFMEYLQVNSAAIGLTYIKLYRIERYHREIEKPFHSKVINSVNIFNEFS